MATRASTLGLTAVAIAAALLLVAMPTHAQTGDITTIAGGGVGDGGRPTLAALTSPAGVAIDSQGDIYIADGAAHRIRKIDIENNIISTFAGTGNPGFSGDGGPASAAALNSPFGLAFDNDDNLYIADSSNNRIRKIDFLTGIITTVAGSGSPGFEGDEGSGLDAAFHSPHGVDVDHRGNIYIADTLNNRIRMVDSFDGVVNTIAGNGIAGSTGDLGRAINAELNQPEDVTVDDLGKVYIADTGNHLIRQIDTQGVIITLAGRRNAEVDPTTVAISGPSQNAVLRTPLSLTLDQGQRNLYVADTGNNLVRRILLNNDIENTLITTEAGSVTGTPGYDGEDRNAIVSSLDSPSGVAVNSVGEIYIADTRNQRVRAVVRAGERRPQILITVAGNGEASFSGERSPATNATLHFPSDIATDSSGNVYFSDTENHRIRQVSLATGLIRTVVGNGVSGSLGVGGRGTNAHIHSPEGMAFDSSGDLYFADTGNHRVLKWDAGDGILTLIAGDGHARFSGQNVDPREASLNRPAAIAIDENDYLYIADTENNRIRVVHLDTNRITTFAGDGQADFDGDGSAARRAKLNKPEGVAVDPDGNIVIADTGNRRIRRVDAQANSISTIAGDGRRGHAGDGGPATDASLVVPRRVAVDADGNVFISDALGHRIRAIKSDGTITTVAGDGIIEFAGDGGPATSASLNRPLGMTLDAVGNLYFADNHNNRIRVIAAPVVEVPTPTPVPTHTPTPAPTATPPPTHTPTPEATPTPLMLPDLVPDDVQYEFGRRPVCRISADEPETAPITFRVVVRNHGNAESGPFIVDANSLSRVTVQRLAVGAAAVVEITGIRSGDNTITVDAASQERESNESNNTTQFKLVLPPQEPIPVCTPSPTPTHTPVPPTATPPPTSTPVPTPVPPTSTPTPVPTNTPTPVPPTNTPTPVPPTNTPTPVPPTSTPTPLPTHTPTTVPIDTPTLIPTRTSTPVPPTATPTATPIIVVVTATPTPVIEVTTGDDDEGSNPGIVIAIIAVVILAIGIILGLYVVYRRRTFSE